MKPEGQNLSEILLVATKTMDEPQDEQGKENTEKKK